MKFIGSLALLATCIASAQTVSPSAQKRYRDLGGTLFEFPENVSSKDSKTIKVDSPRLEEDEIAQRVQDLHNLTTQTIASVLNVNLNFGAFDVRKTIEDLQGRLSGRQKELGERGLPYAHDAKLPGNVDSMVVAFAVLKDPAAAPAPDPFIQFYVRAQTGWALAAEAPNDLSGRTLEIATLPSQNPSEVWVLAWGMRIGDTGTRMSTRLYAFSANSVRTLWLRDHLVAGNIQIKGDHVILTYHELAPNRDHPPTELREDLQLTPSGLR